MVKHSLRKMLDKYPYFLDKRKVSNLYKITKVNNSPFRDLYNALFQTYESFHLNKRVLMWKTQSEPYIYTQHFVCNYPNIRLVEIYKNDLLIHKEEFTEEEEKTNYEWDYNVQYIKTNMLPVKVYRCTECDEIYIGDELPLHCSNCGGNTYITMKVFRCNVCGELFFSNNVDDLNTNSNGSNYSEVTAYRCDDCGKLYEYLPNECSNSDRLIHTENHFTPVTVYRCDNCNVLHTEKPSFVSDDDVTGHFTQVYAYRCLGHIHEDDSEEDEDVPCDEVYFGVKPPNTCQVCGIEAYDRLTELYYNDDSIAVLDNATDYTIPIEFVYTEDMEIDHSITSVEIEEPTDEQSVEYVPVKVSDSESLRIPFPVIPDDKFQFHIETWDEYEVDKGFPENDDWSYDANGDYIPNIYDHDYSLDEIGALNNIPRKTYVNVDSSKYILTEPPYNKQLSEDDYHYMKRMIEYNVRQWIDNPVSLELWKQYSVNSTLVNREKYLLKLFDVGEHQDVPNLRETYIEDKHHIVTDKVKCWNPTEWEHKDKFCDGNVLYGELLFVECDNLRPLPFEDVGFKFKLLNMYGSPSETPFYVDYGYYDKKNKYHSIRSVYDGECLVSFKLISMTAHTVFQFQAYDLDGEAIGSPVFVTVTPRNTCEVDLYVNANSTKNKEDGSKTYPFKSLQKALNNVTKNYTTIALYSDVSSDKELIVSNSCKIIGSRLKTQTNTHTCYNNNSTNTKIHSITNTASNKIFKIIGGKHCTLSLIDVNLSNTRINSYIGLTTWENNNRNLDDYETIILHGGIANIHIEIEDNNLNYYPSDVVKLLITLTDRSGNPLKNQEIRLYFDNDIVATLTSNNEGVVKYNLHTNKTIPKVYELKVELNSNDFFKTSESININCTKTPTTITSTGGVVNITSGGHTSGTLVHVYVDDEYVTDTAVDGNGVITYNYLSTFGKHVITFIDDNGKVLDMIIVETEMTLTVLDGQSFIKNLVKTGDYLTYDKITVSNTTILDDLNGIVLDAKIQGEELITTLYSADTQRVNDNIILYSDAILLQDALIDISYNSSTSKISYNRLGQFWLGDATTPAYINVSSENRIKDGNNTITGKVLSYNGVGIPNIPVKFYEEYNPSEIIFKDKIDFVYNDSIPIKAKVIDNDGSKIKDETVYFEAKIKDSDEYTVSPITTIPTNKILETDDDIVIKTIVHDENSNVVEGVFVKFYVIE